MKTPQFMSIAHSLCTVALVSIAAMTAVQARDFHFSVSGNGSAQGSDRQAALDDAFDRASEQARLVCSGGNGEIWHDRIDRTGTNCAKVSDGDDARYSCMVFVRADCVSRVR